MQTFTGREYLAMDIAGSFGLDKKLWSERLDWYDLNKDHLSGMLNQADEPALFYAGMKAMDSVKAGEATGYPISLDATCSGMQILACLTGDRSAAQLCNVVNRPDGEHRADAYTEVYQAMLAEVGEQPKLKRETTKNAIMTSLYSSKAEPRKAFGDGMLLTLFYKTMERLLPAAWELNETFVEIWNPTKTMYSWVLPDNFHVHAKVEGKAEEKIHFLGQPVSIFRTVNMPTEEGRSLGANSVHSIDGMIVREMVRRCDYDAAWIANLRGVLSGEDEFYFVDENQKKEARRMTEVLWKLFLDSGYLSARILDYLDSETIELVSKVEIQELIDSLPAKPFKLMTVHDCFRCLPNYGNDLRRQYNRQLYLIAKSNMLSHLFTQLLERPVEIGKLDPALFHDVLESDYALS